MKKTTLNSGDFAFLAAHQLKTPLTAVRWYVGELLDGGYETLSNEQKKLVGELKASVEQMTEMINSLLQIGRIRSGRLKLSPVPLDVSLFLKDMILEMEVQLKDKKVKVNVNAEPILPEVLMDRECLKHVLLNLLTNAVNYSSKGKVVNCNIFKKKNHLEVSVQDEGIGISSKDQEGIFKEFFRAKNAMKFLPKGTGLGLVLVKYLVEHWGGKVWFDSKENKGSTFYFTIPLKGSKAKKGDVGLNI